MLTARRLRVSNPTIRHAASRVAVRSLATETQVSLTDPLAVYRGLVATGKVRSDPEQLRALVQMRKVHQNLLSYQPPIRLLTLLESLRPSTDPALANKEPPAWPFKRSPLSEIGMDLLPEEEAERNAILELGEKARSRALVAVLKGEQHLEALDTPKGFLLTGPPGTVFFAHPSITTFSLAFTRRYFRSTLLIHGSHESGAHILPPLQVHDALEIHRLASEEEERTMNLASELGGEGYPWSRREEMKALAITKGWRAVFAGGRSATDPDLNTKEFVLVGIARDLIKEHGWLLAFDEVQLVDIAGAGLINRVLSWYWRLGGVVIGTSNRVPEDLYNAGVQRDSVNAFLLALSSRSPVIEIASPLDYRREQRGVSLSPSTSSDVAGDFGTEEAWKRWGSRAKGWFVKGEEKEFEEGVEWIVGKGAESKGAKRVLKVYGRDLVVPWTLDGVARFTFKDVCESALGPADYITIASNFHTVIITDVPVLKLTAKNEARRLITLLDSLYESKTRLLVSAEVGVDNLFFPDAVGLPGPNASPSPEQTSELCPPSLSAPITDPDLYDILSMPYNSALRATPGVDAAGEVGDSLTQEMLGDVLQDLEAPYRPNISSYDATSGSKAYSADKASQVDKPIDESWKNKTKREEYAAIHPSAATPSFKSLAIFTGEEERFAFRRAVSRVHEMSSEEFLRTAQWTPLDLSFRTWERDLRSAPAIRSTAPSRDSMGAASPLDDSKLSGVLDPHSLRLKFPDGMPSVGREVEIKREREEKEKNGTTRGKRGVKHDLANMDADPRSVTDPVVLKEEHVWGVREDWGPASGKWGKGASAFEKK
ncbi:hypothetical protein P7C70_g6928, partial [Phenoliferia sp. Uapishka_3]